MSIPSLLFSYTAVINNTFGVEAGPPLLFNVTCNHTHSELSQCVHPDSIGLHDCVSQDERAGVTCPELTSISTISPSWSTSNTNVSFIITLAPTTVKCMQLFVPIRNDIDPVNSYSKENPVPICILLFPPNKQGYTQYFQWWVEY